MEVLVKYENGFRFSTKCKGYTVTTGRGEDGNQEQDGMWPAQLFEASIGMCIGGYIAGFRTNRQKRANSVCLIIDANDVNFSSNCE